MNKSDTAKVAELLGGLGATPTQAKVMAEQLVKRAEQMAGERNIPPLEALDYLLKVAVSGREGRVYEGPIPGIGTTKRDSG
jgi:hypothetical protein